MATLPLRSLSTMGFAFGKHFPYKQGKKLKCKIVKRDLQGYAVLILEDEFEAFLDGADPLKFNAGDELMARFISVHPTGRILLYYCPNDRPGSTD